MDPSSKQPSYSYYVFLSEKDKEFVATFIELPGLSGLGPTLADAIKELNEALMGWLEVAKEKGFEIPDPIQKSPLVAVDRSFLDAPILFAQLDAVLPSEIRQEEVSGITGGPITVPISKNIKLTKVGDVRYF